MNETTIVQEYYALATDKNGMMPPMRKDESNAGIVVAGFMDLLLQDIIRVEKKKITVISKLPDKLEHIASLYHYLNEKPRTISKLMQDYYTGKHIKQLSTDVGESLAAIGIAIKKPGGLFGPSVTYVTEKQYKDQLIRVMKAAIADGNIAPRDTALIYILKASKNLYPYFSKYEADELQRRLNEMKKNPQNKQLGEMVDYVNNMIMTIIACIYPALL